MQSNVLLKNLLLSTSLTNRIRHEKDKKIRGKHIGSLVGIVILDLVILGYCLLTAIGFGYAGLSKQIPLLCAVIISAMEFFLCLFKTNGYIFSLSDYDMIMSLPIPVKKIVATRFLYMYVKNLPWVLLISLPLMVSYGIFIKPSFLVYPIWLVLTVFLPMIPMVAATAIGSLIAAAGARSRHKNLVQTILMFVLALFLFSLRFIIEDIFRDNKIDETLQTLSSSMDSIKSAYVPATWFEKSITEVNFLYALIFIVTSLALTELVFLVISRFYKQISSRLMVGIANKNFSLKGLEVRSVTASIAFKEFRCMMASTNYMVNNGLGFILCIILAACSATFGFDTIISFFTHGAPVNTSILTPAIPMIVFFMVGMTSTTSVSYSMEGKNFWIPQSLPLSTRTLVKGKMLFNLFLTVPFAILGNFIIALSAHTTVTEVVLCILCGIIQCIFATTFGMFANLLLPKMDWKNDIEVIKQGASAAIYILPNMFLTMGIGVLSVIVGLKTSTIISILAITIFYLALALLFYIGVCAKSKQ